MKASTFLGQVEKLDTMIKNKLIERQQWEDLAQSITAQMGGERVQSTGNPTKMADAINRCIDMEEEIDRQVERLVIKKQDVVSVVERLKVNEYDVIHKIYIQHMSFDEVAAAKGKSKSWVTTVHGRALANVQSILIRKENNNE